MNNKQNNSRKRRRIILFSIWIAATIVFCVYTSFSIYDPRNPDSLLGVPFLWALVLPLSTGLMLLVEWILNALFPTTDPSKSKARASFLCGILSIIIRFLVFFIALEFFIESQIFEIIIVIVTFVLTLFFCIFGIILSKSAKKGGHVGGTTKAGFVCSIIGIAFLGLTTFSGIVIYLLDIDTVELLFALLERFDITLYDIYY